MEKVESDQFLDVEDSLTTPSVDDKQKSFFSTAVDQDVFIEQVSSMIIDVKQDSMNRPEECFETGEHKHKPKSAMVDLDSNSKTSSLTASNQVVGKLFEKIIFCKVKV